MGVVALIAELVPVLRGIVLAFRDALRRGVTEDTVYAMIREHVSELPGKIRNV